MISYPFNYKFTSVDIAANSLQKVFQRETYDLLAAFGDVGGVNEFLKLVFYFLIASFATIKERSLITKYLFSEKVKDVDT